jgi:hypothetical protein
MVSLIDVSLWFRMKKNCSYARVRVKTTSFRLSRVWSATAAKDRFESVRKGEEEGRGEGQEGKRPKFGLIRFSMIHPSSGNRRLTFFLLL